MKRNALCWQTGGEGSDLTGGLDLYIVNAGAVGMISLPIGAAARLGEGWNSVEAFRRAARAAE